jgi:hypothetical protein
MESRIQEVRHPASGTTATAMKKAAIIIYGALALASCSQDKPAPAQPAQQPAPPPAAPPVTLPSVPMEVVKKIWDEGTQVDFIFYDYPFTMSLNEKPAVQHAVRHISEAPAPLKPECKPTGRATYMVKGDIVLEGNFYFSPGCTYFVFEKERAKAYANLMTEDAIQYSNNQIQQAMKMQQGLQGQ